jgi:hypothetical protein
MHFSLFAFAPWLSQAYGRLLRLAIHMLIEPREKTLENLVATDRRSSTNERGITGSSDIHSD